MIAVTAISLAIVDGSMVFIVGSCAMKNELHKKSCVIVIRR